MKHVSIYLRNNKLFVASMKEATTGMLIVSTPVIVVPQDDDTETRRAIETALANFISDVPHPAEHERNVDENPVLPLAGARTWKQFVVGTKLVTIESNSSMRFIPFRNEGRRGIFFPVSGINITADSTSDAPRALRTAFSLATAKKY